MGGRLDGLERGAGRRLGLNLRGTGGADGCSRTAELENRVASKILSGESDGSSAHIGTAAGQQRRWTGQKRSRRGSRHGLRRVHKTDPAIVQAEYQGGFVGILDF